jgi:hypothetical protein
MQDMDPYFGCYAPKKLDNDLGFFMRLYIFCACEVEPMSVQGKSATTSA